jgi:hypothetical protein
MPFSSTYLAIAILLYFGVDNAEEVVNALSVVIVAGVGFYGRYRAGGVNIFGWRKQELL